MKLIISSAFPCLGAGHLLPIHSQKATLMAESGEWKVTKMIDVFETSSDTIERRRSDEGNDEAQKRVPFGDKD